jgi:hypothetical protein
MNPLDRLREHVADLVDSYPDGGTTHPPLLAQLYNSGARTLVAAESGGRRTVPGSRPPADLSAVDLVREIHAGAIAWSWCLGGHHRNAVTALRWLPDAAAALPGTDTRLDGAEGLYGAVTRWHRQARVVCGWTDRPIDYPEAVCAYCGQRNIRALTRDAVAWCATPGCEDEAGRRPRYERLGLLALIDGARKP